ncbi:MAG: hypothetical protein M1825_001519 [Sarcosagium campestre]|nr:MAG: hypothetical protein M1825_001519 [Sarcosagium campestre]
MAPMLRTIPEDEEVSFSERVPGEASSWRSRPGTSVTEPRMIYMGVAYQDDKHEPIPSSMILLFSDGGDGYATTLEIASLRPGLIRGNPQKSPRVFLIMRYAIDSIRPDLHSSNTGYPYIPGTLHDVNLHILHNLHFPTSKLEMVGLPVELHFTGGRAGDGYLASTPFSDGDLFGRALDGGPSSSMSMLQHFWTNEDSFGWARYGRKHGSFNILTAFLSDLGVRVGGSVAFGREEADLVENGKSFEFSALKDVSDPLDWIVVYDRGSGRVDLFPSGATPSSQAADTRLALEEAIYSMQYNRPKVPLSKVFFDPNNLVLSAPPPSSRNQSQPARTGTESDPSLTLADLLLSNTPLAPTSTSTPALAPSRAAVRRRLVTIR